MKFMKYLLTVVTLSLTLFMTILSVPSTTYASDSSVVSSITEKQERPLLKKALIDWRFKLENDKLYKRLYNYSTGEWEGPWILIG